MAMGEHRQNSRQKSLLRGLVYFNNSPCATECIVRDTSDTGARIKFTVPPAGLVDYLELQIPLKAQKNKCRVVWRTNDEMGLIFLAANSDLAAVSTVDERLHQLEKEIADLKNILRRLQRSSEGGANVA